MVGLSSPGPAAPGAVLTVGLAPASFCLLLDSVLTVGLAPASFCLLLDSHLHGSVSSTSAFRTLFALRCFRDLCLGLHTISSPGFCWMRTQPTPAG